MNVINVNGSHYDNWNITEKRELTFLIGTINNILAKRGINHTELRTIKNFVSGRGIIFAVYEIRLYKKAKRVACGITIRDCFIDLAEHYEQSNNKIARERLHRALKEITSIEVMSIKQ